MADGGPERDTPHAARRRDRRGAALVLLVLVAAAACDDVKRTWSRIRGAEEPLELPALLSTNLPFLYPPALYIQRIHGDVTLQLHIDSLGQVVSESTTVVEHAAHAAFDTAALEGAPRLLFRPARRGERRIARTVLFPIKFRVPGVPPPPQDTMRIKP